MPDVHPGKLAEYRHRERNAQDGYDGHEDARLGEIRYAEVAGRVGNDVGRAGRDHDEGHAGGDACGAGEHPRVHADVEAEGESGTIAFNYHYIFGCLNALSKEKEITLELKSYSQAGIFKSYDKINYLYLVMPVRI